MVTSYPPPLTVDESAWLYDSLRADQRAPVYESNVRVPLPVCKVYKSDLKQINLR